MSSVGGARVLVIGRSPEVLETVLDELSGVGLRAQGTTDPERADEHFDAGEFDLIAFGGGVAAATAERLQRAFRQRNPGVRLLRTFAPRAVREIVTALDDTIPPPEVDVDAYLARIGHTGSRVPTLDTLRALHRRHPDAIVFEAIDVLLDKGVDLAPQAVDAKLIHAGRGGYCFEHNTLLWRVLTELGFTVEGLVGRVRWRAAPGNPPTPPTHMALRVTLDGVPWLVDVGFGGCVLTAPLRMDTSAPQQTDHESFRVIPFGNQWLVQIRIDGRWQSMYELEAGPWLVSDYEVPNWYTSTHPSSNFRQRLMVARTSERVRYTLLGNRLTVRPNDAPAERHLLDADGLERTLRGTFGLDVQPEWRPLLEQEAAQA
ncbi:arylamine N-acetyltransferase [Aquisalimonas lutea]|uniref:arylamine N-acetyltransferase family protein n=1 Tax=Aquisalimonas lutea TaxID=1327750 RepID=UPI0025B2E372|nr:arylamine N-acetyltransferase [Aquisalimonas lutea]MDN3519393.1 arylamine N-acetyltransferase [Aquisalimonas lutea]